MCYSGVGCVMQGEVCHIWMEWVMQGGVCHTGWGLSCRVGVS